MYKLFAYHLPSRTTKNKSRADSRHETSSTDTARVHKPWYKLNWWRTSYRGLGFVATISSSTFQASLDRWDDVRNRPMTPESSWITQAVWSRFFQCECAGCGISVQSWAVFLKWENTTIACFILTSGCWIGFLVSIVPRSEIRPPTCKKSQKW